VTAKCQSCSAPAPNAFICKRCAAELRQLLADLPWWIERLAEAAVGQSKLGDGGRSSRRESDELSKYTDPRPERTDEGFATGRSEGQRRLERDLADPKLVARLLAAGGVNASASTRLEIVGNTLTTWVRDMCESRGVDLPPQLAKGNRTGIATCLGCARWLSVNLGAILVGEDAGRFLAEMRSAVGAIERTVNRPIGWKWLGPCPQWIEARHAICGRELKARSDAIEVTCRDCRQTHNCDRLQLLLINDREREKLTAERILELNRFLPPAYRISERTLRRWRKPGLKGEPPKLKTRGFMRPCECGHQYSKHLRNGKPKQCKCCDCDRYNGREVITRHSEDDEPLYLWADVRKLRVESGKAMA
jgi:hypothetical protein